MREIFLTEIRAAISGGKLLVAFLLMTTAFLISLGMMSQEYEKRMDNHGFSISLKGNELFNNRTFWFLDNGRPEFSGRATMPLAMIKPPDPLIFFARGFDTEMRQGVDFFSTWPILDTNIQPEQEKNLLRLLFPAPDLLFMIKLLAGLLAMLFAFDIICGERERGTLKLMLVSGTPRSSIFAGKYLGGLFSLAVAFSASFIGICPAELADVACCIIPVRRGSLRIITTNSARATPGSPTIRKALRHPTVSASSPPISMPIRVPMGMPRA